MWRPWRSRTTCIVWYVGLHSRLIVRAHFALRLQNMLRKRTYWEHYGPLNDEYQRDPDFYRVHLGQCYSYLHCVSYPLIEFCRRPLH